MTTNLISIIYASAATKYFDRNDLVELLNLSRENNKRLDITGLLLFKGGNFVQAIEGPEEAVDQLYNKIQQDPRHSTVILLSREKITSRIFPDWSMGFQNIDAASKEELEAYSKFLDDDFTPEYFRTHVSRATVILKNFKEYM